jgi:hypothetical protein
VRGEYEKDLGTATRAELLKRNCFSPDLLNET